MLSRDSVEKTQATKAMVSVVRGIPTGIMQKTHARDAMVSVVRGIPTGIMQKAHARDAMVFVVPVIFVIFVVRVVPMGTMQKTHTRDAMFFAVRGILTGAREKTHVVVIVVLVVDLFTKEIEVGMELTHQILMMGQLSRASSR
jgi:hypothetical protein